jgi:phosphomannomutase
MEHLDKLKISISGVRGLCPEHLTSDMVARFVRAYCACIEPGPIVIARDGRVTGSQLSQVVQSTLTQEGRTVFDLQVATLPTSSMAVGHYQAVGAVIVTASHNPEEYNGLKFLNSNGEFIPQDMLDDMVSRLSHDAPSNVESGEVVDKYPDAQNFHIEEVSKKSLSVEKPLNIAVDCNNASGAIVLPQFLRALGHNVTEFACNPDDEFWHIPEPLEKNLKVFEEELKKGQFDIAIAVDPDADRVVFFDEKGRYINEEQGLALFIEGAYYSGYKGDVVVNLSTSQMTDDISARFGFATHRSKVGEKNVVEKMQQTNAVYGGEGGGGMIDGEIHYGRDSLVGTVHVLNLLQSSGQTMSELVQALPKYTMIKHNISFDESVSVQSIYTKVLETFPEASVNQDDGLRLVWGDTKTWLHLRPSNTEPIFRVYLEAKTKEDATRLLEKVEDILLTN